jgi:hypothetical protein
MLTTNQNLNFAINWMISISLSSISLAHLTMFYHHLHLMNTFVSDSWFQMQKCLCTIGLYFNIFDWQTTWCQRVSTVSFTDNTSQIYCRYNNLVTDTSFQYVKYWLVFLPIVSVLNALILNANWSFHLILNQGLRRR